MPLADLDRDLRAYIEGERERLHVPGVAVGVIHGDDEWFAGFGVTNVEVPAPVDDATLFQIGSNTKTFVATAVMREVEAGRIDLDAPLQRYLSNFALGEGGDAAAVTVRHLLTHTGGWDGDWVLVHPQGGRNDDALARTVEAMPQAAILTAPGSLYHYNNTGFSLAGRLLEVVRDQPFEEGMNESLFAPLGLKHAVWFAEQAIRYRTAVGHIIRGGQPQVAPTWEIARASFAAGAIACDIRDLLRWGRFHLGDGRAADGTRVLSAASMAALHTPLVPIGDTTEAVALSWMIGAVDGARTISHNGATNGQMSLHTIYPQQQAAIGLLANADTGSELNRNVTRFIQSRVLGLESRDPEPIDAGDALEEYAGTYERELLRIELARNGERLVATVTPLAQIAGWEASTPPPPVQIGLLEDRDAYVILEGSNRGARGRFIRDDAGAIEWLRWSGRIHRRKAPETNRSPAR
ncbi:MAG: serine hydrolase [Chloroflexi bacterium]|nr:serine hydrolase [Chloroflexota bacterium]MDA1147164.1 serine hydrolase [Chloroflexota bacterium]